MSYPARLLPPLFYSSFHTTHIPLPLATNIHLDFIDLLISFLGAGSLGSFCRHNTFALVLACSYARLPSPVSRQLLDSWSSSSLRAMIAWRAIGGKLHAVGCPGGRQGCQTLFRYLAPMRFQPPPPRLLTPYPHKPTATLSFPVCWCAMFFELSWDGSDLEALVLYSNIALLTIFGLSVKMALNPLARRGQVGVVLYSACQTK